MQCFMTCWAFHLRPVCSPCDVLQVSLHSCAGYDIRNLTFPGPPHPLFFFLLCSHVMDVQFLPLLVVLLCRCTSCRTSSRNARLAPSSRLKATSRSPRGSPACRLPTRSTATITTITTAQARCDSGRREAALIVLSSVPIR